jgi:hypothetical protein
VAVDALRRNRSTVEGLGGGGGGRGRGPGLSNDEAMHLRARPSMAANSISRLVSTASGPAATTTAALAVGDAPVVGVAGACGGGSRTMVTAAAASPDASPAKSGIMRKMMDKLRGDGGRRNAGGASGTAAYASPGKASRHHGVSGSGASQLQARDTVAAVTGTLTGTLQDSSDSLDADS